MHSTFRQQRAGFTMFEFAVVASVFAVLVGVLLMRLSFYQEQAERVAVEQVASTLRTALALREIEVRQKHERGALGRLTEENPFDWLDRRPENYLGEYYGPELEKMPRGNWLFDRRDKCLIYLLNSHESFYSNASKLLKFKVEFAELPTQAAGRTNEPAEIPRSVVLVQVSELSDADTGP